MSDHSQLGHEHNPQELKFTINKNYLFLPTRELKNKHAEINLIRTNAGRLESDQLILLPYPFNDELLLLISDVHLKMKIETSIKIV